MCVKVWPSSYGASRRFHRAPRIYLGPQNHSAFHPCFICRNDFHDLLRDKAPSGNRSEKNAAGARPAYQVVAAASVRPPLSQRVFCFCYTVCMTLPSTKSERREEERDKKLKKLHKGGTLGGVHTKLAATKGFKGTSRRLVQIQKINKLRKQQSN